MRINELWDPWTTLTKCTFARILLLLLGPVIASCSATVNETTIATGNFLIGPQGVEFRPEQPLLRSRNALSIRLKIEEDWKPEPPWEAIILEDGRRVKIIAQLVAADGSRFESGQIGRSNGVDLRFLSLPPKKLPIVAIILTADSNIHCRAVVWHEYNPI